MEAGLAAALGANRPASTGGNSSGGRPIGLEAGNTGVILKTIDVFITAGGIPGPGIPYMPKPKAGQRQ